MCERLAVQGIQIKAPALWHQLDKWGLSFLKTLCANEQERDDVQQARREWIHDQPTWDPGSEGCGALNLAPTAKRVVCAFSAATANPSSATCIPCHNRGIQSAQSIQIRVKAAHRKF